MLRHSAAVYWGKLARTMRGRNDNTPIGLLANVSPQLWDGFLAMVIAFVAQFLILGIEVGLDNINCPFPATILAMLVVFGVFLVVGWVFPFVEEFYKAFLKGPTDILNRHMSIGFTTPFVMICRNPLARAETIGVIIASFVVTGIINISFTYGVAFPLQAAVSQLALPWRKNKQSDVEKANGFARHQDEKQAPDSTVKTSNQVTNTSSASSFVSNLYVNPDTSGDECGSAVPPERGQFSPTDVEQGGQIGRSIARERPSCRYYNWASHHPILILCWLIAILIGLPLRLTTDHEVTLDTFLLFSLWLTTLAVQAGIKTQHCLRPWLRALLAGCANAVLWTSLAMMAYAWIEAACSHNSIGVTLDAIQTNTTFAEFVLQRIPAATSISAISTSAMNGSATSGLDSSSISSNITTNSIPSSLGSAPTMGAGDIATTILNAGLVSWGLKLYECRRQLLSRAGATVLAVSTLAALLNVALGPLVAHALGLRAGATGLHTEQEQQQQQQGAAEALAFAARSATLALGGPALAMLGGDPGLNAALVVTNGILFQMALGFGAGAALEKTVDQAAANGVQAWRGLLWIVRGEFSGRRAGTDLGGPEQRGRGQDADPPGQGKRGAVVAKVVPASVTTGVTATTATPIAVSAAAVDTKRESSAAGQDDLEATDGISTTWISTVVGDAKTVAAGVTIGVNSAAMGTAHLYEVGSAAAPYAALSMTTLGIMTVVFASVRPLAAWIIAEVGGT